MPYLLEILGFWDIDALVSQALLIILLSDETGSKEIRSTLWELINSIPPAAILLGIDEPRLSEFCKALWQLMKEDKGIAHHVAEEYLACRFHKGLSLDHCLKRIKGYEPWPLPRRCYEKSGWRLQRAEGKSDGSSTFPEV